MDMTPFKKLGDKLANIMTDSSKLSEYYGLEFDDAAKETEDYRKATERVILNDFPARDYVIDQYVKLLMHLGFTDKNVMLPYINFDSILENDDYIVFEMLLAANDLSYYLRTYKIGVRDDEDDPTELTLEELISREVPEEYPEKFSSKKLRDIAEKEVQTLRNYYSDMFKRVELLASIVLAYTFGAGPLDSLGRQGVSEVATRDKDYIYVIYKGVKIWLSFLKFTDTITLKMIQKNSTTLSARQFEETNPALVTAKANGSRVTVVGFGATPDAQSVYYNERVFALDKLTLEDMLTYYQSIDRNMFAFMILNQRGRGSFLVSGADMGVGKSSTLIALLGKTPVRWGIGILDPQNEMQMRDKFPHINSLTVTPTNDLSIAKCFEIILKQARDVLCVSEIAGPEEMAELIKAGTRLNSGVSGTIHSISPEEVVPNCTELLMNTGNYDTRESAETAVAKCINLVYQQAILPGGRIITESISEIVPVERDIYVGDLYLGDKYSREQKEDRLLDLQQMLIAKQLYSKPYRVNPLFVYNRNTDRWDIKNRPTEGYFQKVGTHLRAREMKLLRSLFAGVS